ncbi:hypothetical protein Csa_020733, partial [Cucumis sativus]
IRRVRPRPITEVRRTQLQFRPIINSDLVRFTLSSDSLSVSIHVRFHPSLFADPIKVLPSFTSDLKTSCREDTHLLVTHCREVT